MASFSSTSSFLCDIGKPRHEQNKMGYQISRRQNTVLLQCWQKKHPAKKVFFLSLKDVFLRNFLFQLFEDGIL